MLLLVGALTVFSFVMAYLIASIIKAKRALDRAKTGDQQQQGHQPAKPVLTRAIVQANIAEDQWDLLVKRLGRALTLENEDDGGCGSTTTAWSQLGKEQPRCCVGFISLDVDNAYNEKRLRPIPLLREVRAKLIALGFVISADGLWATYVEQKQEQGDAGDDKAVTDDDLARIGELMKPKY